MQVLSNQLVAAIERDGGTVLMKHRVTKLQPAHPVGWCRSTPARARNTNAAAAM